MEVVQLNSTSRPERLVCQAARGDYYGGFVGDTEYAELMEPIDGDTIDEKTETLINQLLDRGHYGPFESPSITFAIKGVSRSLMAQLTRHRHLSFDVQSMRYVEFDEASVKTPISLRTDEHFTRDEGEVDVDERERIKSLYEWRANKAVETYNELVDAGVPKEDARFILPIGTKVNMTVSGNLRAFLHVLNMRQKADAQYEIRQLSDMIAEELAEWAPYTAAWFEQHGPLRESP